MNHIKPLAGLLQDHAPENCRGERTDLGREDDEVGEEGVRDLPELSHLYGRADPEVNEEDVHHPAAVKVGDLHTHTLLLTP